VSQKVVQQHTEGMVGNVMWILLEIFFSFQQLKNFENQLRIDKVIAMSLVYYGTFFGDTVFVFWFSGFYVPGQNKVLGCVEALSFAFINAHQLTVFQC